VNTSNDDYGVRWTGEGVAYPYPSSRTWSDAERELAEARAEIERLRQQVAQRGARMQIMREAFRETDWLQFVSYEHPEASDWFDDDGVPK
jgi:hypothetical protein